MPNVVAVIQDDRVRRQVEQYLQELGMEDLRFATFKRVEEFEALYFKDHTPEPVPESPAEPNPTTTENAPPKNSDATAQSEASEEEAATELRLFSEVHLIIFALDSVGGKSSPWIDKTRLNLKKYKLWPENNQLRWVLLKYEDDGISKLDLLHPALDDLIYLPLDRLIFLQKLEILINLPKTVKPRFLFSQQVQQQIEISKITKLDRLSDVGMAIRNPVKLKSGIPSKFYLQLPGEKGRLQILGKVLRSEPHPEFPGQFLVYFTFFSLHRNDLTAIRRTLSKSPQYKSLKTDDRETARFDPDDLFLSDEDKRIFGVAVVDPDEQNASTVADQLRKDMDRLQVVTESSYSLFLHRYLESSGGKSEKTPPKPTDDTDFYSTPISLSVAATDLKCLSVDPGPSTEDLFLGHPAAGLFSTPDKWLSLMEEKETRLIVEESVQLAMKGRVLTKLLTVIDSANHRRAVNFKFYKGSTDQIVMIDLSPAGLNDLVEKMTSPETNKTMEALVVDSTFVPDEPSSWIEGLRMRAAQVGLIKKPDELRFLILAETDYKPNRSWIENPELLSVLNKPVDFRQLLFHLSENLQNKNTLFKFENLGWAQPALSIHVSKAIKLEALSEFGATLAARSPLVPGSVVYLRKSIYENAPNGCLAARVYSCEESPSEKGTYIIHLTYFGINDAFLKYARTWIRENYAAQKSKGEG